MKNNLIGISSKIKCGKDLIGEIIQYLNSYPSVPYSRWEEELVFLTTETKQAVSGYEIKKFADKIKDTVCLWLGCTREQLESQEFKNSELGEEWWHYKLPNTGTVYPIFKLVPFLGNEGKYTENALIKLTPRKLLQLLGTECGRQIIHPNIWINATFADWKKESFFAGSEIVEKYPNWIITDVRFPNEVQAIKDRGGIVIRVNRRIDLRFPKLWEEFIKINPSNSEEKHFIFWLKNHSNEKHRQLGASLTHESETSLDDYTDFDYVIDNNGTIEELVKKVKNIL